MGMNSVASVQMTPTPMTPAPMKRTCDAHRLLAKALMDWPSGMGVVAVSTGTATSQAISSPTSMATPATMPIR
ncbi:Uncharacterised protein [Bordetella pertussis]|nr:Uncharacterised protein [Bordetella pertussis]